MKTEMIITAGDLRGQIYSDFRPDGDLYDFVIQRRGAHVFAGHGFQDLATAMTALQRAMLDLLQPEQDVAA